jgi:hypothetical protein
LLTEADKQSKGDMARFASLYRPASASSSACAAETVTNDEVDESMVSVGSSVESPQEVYDEGEFEEVVGENLEAAGLGAAGLLPPEPQVPPGVAAMTAAAEKAPPLTPKAQWATKEKKKRGAGGPRKKHPKKRKASPASSGPLERGPPVQNHHSPLRRSSSQPAQDNRRPLRWSSPPSPLMARRRSRSPTRSSSSASLWRVAPQLVRRRATTPTP